MDKQQIWAAVLGELELSLSKANFTTWFKNTSVLDYDTKKVTIAVPNTFTKDWLKKKYEANILEALKNVIGGVEKIEYEVKSPMEIKEVKLHTETKQELPEEKPLNYSINPRYTFESFIVGNSNKLAHAACLGVAKSPGKKYNPLFIYGGVGLGKTHLIQGIGNEILQQSPKKKVLYIPSEKFVNDFIASISSQRTNDFKNKYRNVDVLMIDDIQFLAGKESTQEEFFHTFNTLYELNKQIVLSSDRPPRALNTLEERIRSRFEGGMIVDIQAPDLETRIAILSAKCKSKDIKMPIEVMEFIAQSIQQNVRELEGALTRVVAYSELNNTSPSIEVAKSSLETVLSRSKNRTIKIQEVLDAVSISFDIRIKDLLSPKRNKEIVLPRQIIMYLLREDLHLSFPQIAKALGGRDHTTIMHGYRKMKNLIKEKDTLRHDIDAVKDKIYTI
ncbi:chromosomal replication initiator protein DnaA [bacterium CG06_land_8_20_14_3_00_33_50]|nr:MAG: chromosomal replication initiator protein DnaA [bacterium CG10_big_fil_rev_8_21_14_0_10_33_18]PIU76289.1 MAG: chromosomal replication initiator protein DnaA [bacterium CG06_land_8_20_14_3_00_33_50]PIW81125.1 MAG: chromosomal replication initiator protein DnaA [bacterium CG_4_8_14_3_um_filter_33_28]PJA72256.1 MAG: chromosomal replication initiator protein DnaA [bacterium CG_4_9_14_3_um_filter_33_26]